MLYHQNNYVGRLMIHDNNAANSFLA